MLPEEAYFLIRGRDVQCPHLASIIKGSKFDGSEITERSHLYANYLSEVRSITFKEWILSDDDRIYEYAEKVIKGRWIEYEDNITNPCIVSKYAKNIIKGRWKEKEPLILKSNFRDRYAEVFIPEGSPREALEAAVDGKEYDESIICFDAQCSYEYARYVLKGRFEAGEGSIFSDDSLANLYQKYVTKEPITFSRIIVASKKSTSDPVATQSIVSHSSPDRCKAMTMRGTQCFKQSRPNSDYCCTHYPMPFGSSIQ